MEPNWFDSPEALRWALVILCWSDAEAAAVMRLPVDVVTAACEERGPVPVRVRLFMPCAHGLLGKMWDARCWCFPPRRLEGVA